jgi:hypothetical protein
LPAHPHEPCPERSEQGKDCEQKERNWKTVWSWLHASILPRAALRKDNADISQALNSFIARLWMHNEGARRFVKDAIVLKSLQGRLTLLFVAFVLLVLISVGATMWGLETQRQDAPVIHLAGRQRMLAQQMARLAFRRAIAIISGAGSMPVAVPFSQPEV